MITRLTDSPAEAATFIRKGGIVAFPTETVYGLGADVFNEEAVRRIFAAKERPADNPLIAHVAESEDISLLTDQLSQDARRLITAFFPGPLTLVLRKNSRVPYIATAGLETIGVRMPSHAVAREFLKSCGVPVVAPSANLSGRPSPTTWQAVYEDLDGRIDCILQGDRTDIGIESTVVDCSSETPVVLRKGAVSLERLREVVPEIVDESRDPDSHLRSPGLRHRHYTPRADVIIVYRDREVRGGDRDAYIGLSEPPEGFRLSRVCASIDDYAAALYEFFRECDRQAVERIYCESVPQLGIGAALMDRIRRASGG